MLKYISHILLIFVGSFFFSAEIDANENELVSLFNELKLSDNDSLSNNISLRIEQKLCEELRTDDSSFYRPYSQLVNLGKCYSEDKELRIYTWSYPLQDKSFGYGGIIEFKPTKKRKKANIKPIILNAHEGNYMPQIGNKISSSNWYGALYYKIIPTKFDGKTYYILLGWSGYDAVSDFKIAETLRIENMGKRVIFGGVNLFKGKGRAQNRILLQFSNDAHVALNYDPEGEKIIMDHLSPSLPGYQGVYSYYGPDFSYDAYVFDKKNNGLWMLQEDIDVKNKE